MQISFLSYFIDNHIPVYGGYDDQIRISKKSSIDNGDTANSLNILLNNHSIPAPLKTTPSILGLGQEASASLHIETNAM